MIGRFFLEASLQVQKLLIMGCSNGQWERELLLRAARFQSAKVKSSTWGTGSWIAVLRWRLLMGFRELRAQDSYRQRCMCGSRLCLDPAFGNRSLTESNSSPHEQLSPHLCGQLLPYAAMHVQLQALHPRPQSRFQI